MLTISCNLSNTALRDRMVLWGQDGGQCTVVDPHDHMAAWEPPLPSIMRDDQTTHSKYKVWFLLNAQGFYTMVKEKNPKSNYSLSSLKWELSIDTLPSTLGSDFLKGLPDSTLGLSKCRTIRHPSKCKS